MDGLDGNVGEIVRGELDSEGSGNTSQYSIKSGQ